MASYLLTLLAPHRYTVASADPEQVITKLSSLPKQADDRLEVDKKARSLTRSLTRSAASSPLVQLLATHRKRRLVFAAMLASEVEKHPGYVACPLVCMLVWYCILR